MMNDEHKIKIKKDKYRKCVSMRAWVPISYHDQAKGMRKGSTLQEYEESAFIDAQHLN